ncbi:hypothetical protein [Granulicella tundricola]|uniref:Transmembrane protein n=1 Tax=Granulicella tundricola (strain ATCC BAA-1859 / DSM 23138 / MP5ACTX9) TaxID=1198114 RepID=E8X1L7_GRATM|nr:hypothetical protein [Granulicella tundricola]ADW70252.1 hypothetical protein AciX9_3241 [Granulicella tundricola MP5ACTX9]
MSFDNVNDQTEQKPTAFCQNCGKPLDPSTMRVVGPAIYCEPCLAAKLGIGGAVPPPSSGTAPGSAAGQGAGYSYTSTVYTPVGGTTSWAVPPYTRSTPNPGLAALLGFIPGVGAMYNEQYAKGIVHLLVFAMLISLSHATDLFGLIAAGWIAYMVIEAHHTARARRDGTPLPNPFGLNDLSERLGFGKNWGAPSAPGTGAWPNPPAPAPQPVPTAASEVPVETAPPVSNWGAPIDAAPPAWHAEVEQAKRDVPYANSIGSQFGSASYNQGYAANAGYYPPVQPVPPVPPYGVPYSPVAGGDPLAAPGLIRKNRFPAGAVWLIGLGIVFLLATTGIFEGMFGESLVGFGLIALAVWIFIKRMLDSGYGLTSDGSANYPLRVMRALRPSSWLFLIGFLIVLDRLHVVYWVHSWPWLVVLAGLMMLIERFAYNSAAAASQYAAMPPAPAAYAGTSIVPTATNDQHEGGN